MYNRLQRNSCAETTNVMYLVPGITRTRSYIYVYNRPTALLPDLAPFGALLLLIAVLIVLRGTVVNRANILLRTRY